MRRSLAALSLVAGLLAASCGAVAPTPQIVYVTPQPTLASPAAIPSPEPTPTPEPALGPTPTPDPTPPPEDLVVTRFWSTGTAVGSDVFVELKNPSAEWGLNRAEFEVALLDKGGGVIDVIGKGGVPGASCCTIYQLEPSGTYVAWGLLSHKGLVAGAEARTISDWTYWPDIAESVPSVRVTGAKSSRSRSSGAEFNYAVRGRVTTKGGTGPYNVRVVARYESSKGFFIVDGTVECVKPDRAYAFEVSTLITPPAGATFKGVEAFTTTVPPEQPPGC